MGSEWIQSKGGPLLLLPSELLSGWGGTTTTDYERACEVCDEVAGLEVGNGVGLVLGDEPHQTAWASEDDGGLLVRWVCADDEADVWAAVDGVDDCDFDARAPGSFVVGPAGRCVLLDAADAGRELEGGHLAISLSPGTYSVQTANLAPNDATRLLVHRLRRIRW